MALNCRWKKTKTGWSLRTKNGACRIKPTGGTVWFDDTPEYAGRCRRPDLNTDSAKMRGGLLWVKDWGCHLLTWLD